MQVPGNIPDKIANAAKDIDSSSNDGADLIYRYERERKVLNEKHRNLIVSFDHFFTIITHPFFLFIVCIVVSAFAAALKYFGIAFKNEVLTQMSTDFFKVLSYLATIIVTAVFTNFLEKKKHL